MADELLWQLRTSKSLDEAFEHVNMIEKFGTAMLLSERLTFLGMSVRHSIVWTCVSRSERSESNSKALTCTNFSLHCSPMTAPTVVFCCTVKYREYHRLLQSRDFEEAASILVKVLNSPDMAPRWYWIDLVREACHLLRAAPQQAAVFNIEEVGAIFYAAKSVTTARKHGMA